jgi:hypothetical protein
MTLTELRACLDRLGIVLEARANKLHWTAPPGAMTPAIKAAVAEHKPALLALLVEAGPTTDPLDLVVDQITRRRGVPAVAVEGGRLIEPRQTAVPGPAVLGPPPPDPEQVRRIRERFAALAIDDYARQERAAIMEFDGGLIREAAGRAAGLH